MKSRLEQALKQFIPASLIFAGLFLLLRFYEWMLVQSRMGDEINILSLEFGSLGYDLIFIFAIISVVMMLHVMVSAFLPKTAFVLSNFIFVLFLGLAFSAIQYFSHTLVPLSADLFGYPPEDIITTLVSSGGVGWLTFAPLIILTLLMAAGFLEIRRRNFYKNNSLAVILSGSCIFFGAWFLPHSPAPENFDHDIDYFLAVNKTQYFLSQTVDYFNDRSIKPTENKEYPFLHPVEYKDGLNQFFNTSGSDPNIVFIIVEGLGRDFTGPDARYGGFTPFLDSLSQRSLYWENFLSNAGRTFGALPSILGSLPYGREGFMSLGANMPSHQTLISLLKPFGYQSHFFYGGNPNFDNQDIFLEYQGFDKMIDQTKFPDSFGKNNNVDEGYSWGYPDREVFSMAAQELQEVASPHIDVYLTLSTHEPFIVPDKTFDTLFAERLEQLHWSEPRQRVAGDNSSIFSCLLYTDDAIRKLMQYYESREDFKNTIFIITGDHRLIPLPDESKLNRFHVPMIIFSPLLKEPHTFSSLAVHSDITPSILGLLSMQYGYEFPAEMPFLSGPLSTSTEFSSTLDLALIRNKNGTNDYLEGEYLLSDQRLYKILPNLVLKSFSDETIKNRLAGKLKQFKVNAVDACENNRLDKKAQVSQRKVFIATKTEEAFVQSQELSQFTPEQQFDMARTFAFRKEYFESRSVLKSLLNKSPNYHDARILLARTYGWAKEYDSAILYLNQTLERTPAYADAFCAWADVEYWRGNQQESLAIVTRGLAVNDLNEELLSRKARALMLLNKKEDARQILNDILNQTAKHELANELLRQLNEKNSYAN